MPWRPMLSPVDACTDARGVATHAAASSRIVVGGDAGDRGDRVGGVRGDERPQLVDVACRGGR